MTRWDELNARARGLSTRLLGHTLLERLAEAPDLAAIATELRRRGFLIAEPETATAPGIELAVRRNIAARLATLARWAGARTPTLAVLFEDEDRRSIAALLRGAVQRAPAEERLAGLVPTPELPERALEELAGQPSPASVAALLVAWDHPFGPPLLSESAKAAPDLARLESLLGQAFAGRALAGAARDGRRGVLYGYVQEVIDLANAFAALILTAETEHDPSAHWLPGGRGVALSLFQRAVATHDVAAAGDCLASGFANPGIRAAFADLRNTPDGVERRVLRAQIRELQQAARLSPLSAAPLLHYALHLRAEALDLRRVIWGLRLGASAPALAEGMVSES